MNNNDIMIYEDKDGKNYLTKNELKSLELIISAFFDLAENRAKRHILLIMMIELE